MALSGTDKRAIRTIATDVLQHMLTGANGAPNMINLLERIVKVEEGVKQLRSQIWVATCILGALMIMLGVIFR